MNRWHYEIAEQSNMLLSPPREAISHTMNSASKLNKENISTPVAVPRPTTGHSNTADVRRLRSTPGMSNNPLSATNIRNDTVTVSDACQIDTYNNVNCQQSFYIIGAWAKAKKTEYHEQEEQTRAEREKEQKSTVSEKNSNLDFSRAHTVNGDRPAYLTQAQTPRPVVERRTNRALWDSDDEYWTTVRNGTHVWCIDHNIDSVNIENDKIYKMHVCSMQRRPYAAE